jgi:tripartite-type tricarboxylate transporter receptor subunit TctC
MDRRLALQFSAAALAAPAWAQADWPGKPVHLVVPAPAGSSLDIVARLLSDKLKDRWGQPVVVDNKIGAGGLIGVDVAAKAAPDGTTIAVGFNGPIAFAPFLYRKMPFDPARDLVAVVLTTSQPNVLAVNAGLPVHSVKDFVAWARERAGKLNYSSLGNGSSSQLTMAMFLAEAGITGTHVPYNGSPPSALAVAQGDVDATFMVEPALLPHQKAGRVRLIATSGSRRLASLADLPTLAESGYPTIESMAWNGLFVAAGTPDAVVRKINADVNQALSDPALRAALALQGLTPVGGSSAEFVQLLAAERRRWGPVIERIGLKID